MNRDQMKIGGYYNWRNQPERLIYLGRNWSGNGFWHQFALIDKPNEVWSEILDADLQSIEETAPSIRITSDIEDARITKPHRQRSDLKLSARQARKARKAAKREQTAEKLLALALAA